MQFKRVCSPGEGVTGLGGRFFEKGWTVRESGKQTPRYEIEVPGNVRLALMKAGIILDPFILQQNEQSKWVSTVAWEYENNLDYSNWETELLNKIPMGGLVHLVFDAIDYDATFILNHEKICRQVGMFSPIDIITGITPEQKSNQNQVPIKVHFNVQPFWRQHAVKSQMAFGWDFAPEIRTVGIWKNVRMHYTGAAFFTEAYAIAAPINPKNVENCQAKLKLNICIDCIDPASLTPVKGAQSAEIQLKTDFFEQSLPINFTPGSPISVDCGEVEIPLWSPWSLGKPIIIPITVSLLWNGNVSDEYRGTIVNRQIKWLRNPGSFPGNENWTLSINSKPIFVRGINWVPPDSLYGRISAERYQKLVNAALDMNIDLLRVWGGGIEEKPEFYDYCDKVGMMVWQEFPYACTNYPNYPEYMKIATNECNGMVQRTRRHPSVVTYCGGNEYNPYINSHIISMVKDAVSAHAPDRFCFAASPYRGDDHNWRVWGSRRPFEGYDVNGIGPFQMLTEYGMQAAPNLKTLQECCECSAETKMAGIEANITYHKGDMNGLHHYAKAYGDDFKDVGEFIHKSQALQAYALKYAVEVCRSCWPNVSGVLPWQLSDPWPNISWSVIDHHFRPKKSYQMLKSVYAPVLPMIRFWRKVDKNRPEQIGDVIVHNATQEKFDGTLEIQVIERKNGGRNVLKTLQRSFSVSPQRPLKVGSISVVPDNHTIILERLFNAQHKLVASNFAFPLWEIPASKSKRLFDSFNMRFDSWWRIHVTKLMELDKIREERPNWLRLKELNKKK